MIASGSRTLGSAKGGIVRATRRAPRLARGGVALVGVAALLAACSSAPETEHVSDGGSSTRASGPSGGSQTSSSGPSPEDAGADATSGTCPALDAGVAGDNVAQGTATGAGLDCTFCALGASVYTDYDGDVLFGLAGNGQAQGQAGDTVTATGNTCRTPSGATYLDLVATLYYLESMEAMGRGGGA